MKSIDDEIESNFKHFFITRYGVDEYIDVKMNRDIYNAVLDVYINGFSLGINHAKDLVNKHTKKDDE